ncbi:hypothetical protein OR617_09775 [Pasteurella multocida]|uniref:DUF7168 domain-containing protein n=1 Tax=Pasteurella multocida TaxID=747 RepID=UPI002260D325|nr:hypothetical protein [Pasteurella multocida]UZV64433.1 hypothetical protein OR617_09775 [Pasteurella multocida]
MGQEERPVIASYCFDVLYRQLQQARKAFIATQSKRLKRSTLIARADNYCLGWVHGVYKTVQDFVLTQEEKEKMERFKNQLHKKMNLRKLKLVKLVIPENEMEMSLVYKSRKRRKNGRNWRV